MKAVAALVFLGLVALSSAGLVYQGIPTVAHQYSTGLVYSGVPTIAHQYHAYQAPIAYTSAAYHTAANYRLNLDTSLPGSAYAAYPNAAAPTAYGYGVIKTL